MLHRNGSWAALLALSAAGLTLGCGDGAICPSEIVVVFQTPAPAASVSGADDLDPGTAGIQTNVSVKSNLKKGDEFVLSITDTGGAVAQVSATSNGDGDVTFEDVTLPSGEVTMAVTGTSGSGCGTGSDEVTVSVITEAACGLAVVNGPLSNDFFAPIPVLNSTNDSDAALPNFQANFEVSSVAGFDVELFVLDVETGMEAAVGTVTADSSSGLASFATTLAQGRKAIRATCSKGGINEASATNTVEVDTVVPSCELIVPAEGITVTPDDDSDGDLGNGIQMTWRGTIDDASENDTDGESASFFRDALQFNALPVDDGASASELAEFTAPGTFALGFSTQDHAGNPCSAGFDVGVILDGCSISVDQPATIVLSDSDADDSNGMQTDVLVTVGTDCAGLDVFVDCGEGETSVAVAGDGVTTVPNVTLDTDSPSEGVGRCTARVVNSDNFETSDGRDVTWDTLAPGVNLVLVSPSSLSCGDSIARNTLNDADSNLANGFQIAAAVSAPLAVTRDLTVTNSGGTDTIGAPSGGVAINVTLLPGANDVRAVVSDAVGNEATSVPCNLVLEDITVDFDDPVDDGIVGIADGTVDGAGDLNLPVCVTVSEPGVTVTVTVDSTDFATAFNGTSFCTTTDVPLGEGTRVLTATAVSPDSRQGSRTLDVSVDLTSPGTITGLAATSSDHQSIDLSWDAEPTATTYLIRFATSDFSADPAVFLTQGEDWPGLVVSETTQLVGPIDSGTAYFIGVVAIDGAGNMSATTSVGPITPDYDATDSFSPALADFNPATQRGPNFGIRSARGDYNNDGFDDVAIAAPFNQFPTGAVYIYFGSVTGIATGGIGATTPDVVIQATSNFGFGNSLVRLNWSGGDGDGLAIGAPFPGGAVFVFHSDTLTNATGTLSEADRDIEIEIDGAATDWFTGGRVGWSLASGQLDAVGTQDDLIIGVPRGGINGGKSATSPGGNGGVAILYGGAITAGQDTITLSSNPVNANLQGLAGLIFENPETAVNSSQFSYEVAYLGDTRAGNGVGDIAISFYADALADTSDNIVFVLRGRTLLVPGMSFTTFVAGTDLRVVNPTPDETNEFGISMGSIADVSGDGFRDIVIGARLDNGTNDGTSTNTGRAWILDGSRTGTLTLSGTDDYITKISSVTAGTRRIGAGIANNALTASPDVNGDGVEDLVFSSGPGDLRVWFGGSIPAGDIEASTSDYLIPKPAAFTNSLASGFPAMVPVTWLGDINGDGLTDLGRADWSVGPDAKGIYDILWDE